MHDAPIESGAMKPYSEMSKDELIQRLRSVEQGAEDDDRDELDRIARNEACLTAILDTAVEGIITIDHRGVIDSVNLAAERLFQYTAGELAGKKINVLMPTPFRQEHDGYMSRYLETGEPHIIGIGREVLGLRRDGSIFPLDLSVSEVKAGGKHLFVGFIRDISDRKRAEVDLKKSEERLAAVLDHSPLWISMKDLEGRYRIANRRFQEMVGRPVDKILGHTDKKLFNSQTAERLLAADHGVIASGEPQISEETLMMGDSLRHFIVHRFPLFDEEDQPYAVCSVAVDVTERRKLEKELLDVRQEEHQRIGQDLHDNLGQQLTGIEFMSQALSHGLKTEGHARAGDAERIAALVREAISHTRLVARGLNPVEIAGEGLMDSLAELALNTSEVFKVDCSFDCPEEVLLHDAFVGNHLYRIAQEAVNNAIKHGQPSKIVISLEKRDDGLNLGILDDGKGFSSSRIRKGGRGMGLRVMRHRASVIDGSLEVEQNSKGGTAVLCKVAVPDPGKKS